MYLRGGRWKPEHVRDLNRFAGISLALMAIRASMCICSFRYLKRSTCCLQRYRPFLILVLVLTPGYIANAVARRSEVPRERSDFRFLFRIAAFGIAVHALLFPWTLRFVTTYFEVRSNDILTAEAVQENTWELLAWGLALVAIAPAIVGLTAAWATNPSNRKVERILQRLDLGHLSYIGRTQSAWEYILDKEEPFYVRIYLEDGSVIGGLYSTDSLGSVDPDYEDIYVESLWILDDNDEFVAEVPTSRGVWVPRSSVRYVEFLEGEDDNNDEQQ